MTTLIRLEDPRHPTVGALAITFPSGACKALQWRSEAPIADSLALAKDLAARALQTCLDERRTDDAERTNWASVTAAAHRIVKDWNELQRQAVDNLPEPVTKH
jgi:hypothetical protein